MGKQIVCADEKNRDGEWILEVKRIRTVSGAMWKSIQARTKLNGAEQQRREYYRGCTNGFSGFQDFVDWHVNAVGYGLGYQIDKDLLMRGNKVYSREFCVLLPLNINTLMTNRRNFRGDYPVGVTYDKRSNGFNSVCSDGRGYQQYIGRFKTAEDAFFAYKEYKENLFKELANKYKESIDPRAYDALLNYKISMED